MSEVWTAEELDRWMLAIGDYIKKVLVGKPRTHVAIDEFLENYIKKVKILHEKKSKSLI